MSAGPHRLSKSKIAAFEHCPRRLWLQVHRRDEARFDADTLARFRFGHHVGAEAAFLVPDGIMVDVAPDDMATALARTAELLRAGPARPIFEATFQHQGVLCRVDILEPFARGWRAIEVKASTRVKAYELADLATQVWVMRGTGLHVRQAVIRHLAPPFSWARPDIAAVRFVDADVTQPLERYLSTRGAVAHQARRTVEGAEVQRATGPHCERPFTCEFRQYCSRVEATPLLAWKSEEASAPERSSQTS